MITVKSATHCYVKNINREKKLNVRITNNHATECSIQLTLYKAYITNKVRERSNS